MSPGNTRNDHTDSGKISTACGALAYRAEGFGFDFAGIGLTFIWSNKMTEEEGIREILTTYKSVDSRKFYP